MDALRSRWLNPPEWTREEVLEFPGSLTGPWARYVHDADARGIGTVRSPHLAPRDDAFAKQLAKRTLTNFYNERPTWLDLAHRRLDEAVFAACGWPSDLSDDDLLARLLELNLEVSSRSVVITLPVCELIKLTTHKHPCFDAGPQVPGEKQGWFLGVF